MTRQEKSTLPRVAAKAKGSFINYVDTFLDFFFHLPALQGRNRLRNIGLKLQAANICLCCGQYDSWGLLLNIMASY